jgi:hypothetical protein
LRSGGRWPQRQQNNSFLKAEVAADGRLMKGNIVMKEKPILFSAPMILAILRGEKTMTRRIFKEHPLEGPIDAIFPDGSGKGFVAWWGPGPHTAEKTALLYPGEEGLQSPYGVPGDRLWVRENYRFSSAHDYLRPSLVPFGDAVEYTADPFEISYLSGRQRPSIHMPRWVSRITLEITAVKVERLKNITEQDAMAEGCRWTDNGPRKWLKSGVSFEEANKINGWNEGFSHTGDTARESCYPSAKVSFAALWESINGSGSWFKNPWVWVVGFKVVKG